MITPSKTLRRPLKFRTPAELKADLQHLQTVGYKKAGNWSLPQACRHLAVTIESNLTPPESDIPTAEESAMKAKFFGMINAPGGMPENLPIGNAALIPDESCSEVEIDRLNKAFETLAACKHKCIKVGRCGPVPLDELNSLHLAHAAHHLSFLVPNISGAQRGKPADYRKLRFNTISDAIADIDQSSAGCRLLGTWDLPTVARHVVLVLWTPFQPPSELTPTSEQAKAATILDTIIATGERPTNIPPAPPEFMPPAGCTPADVADLKRVLNELAAYPHSHIATGRFGPVPIEKYRQFQLIHLAHHLGFLVPEAAA